MNGKDVKRSAGALEGFFSRPKSSYEGLSGEEVTAEPGPADLLYIRQCSNCQFSVTGKSAKCIIEQSQNLRVNFQEPIMSGTLELISCKDVVVAIRPQDRLPSVSVDGCEGVQLHLCQPLAVGGIYCAGSHRVSVHFQPPHPAEVALNLPANSDATEQWVSSWEQGKMVTARAVREGAGYVTTAKKKAQADARDRELKRRFEEYLRGLLERPTAGKTEKKAEEEKAEEKERKPIVEKPRLQDLSPNADPNESPLVAEMRAKRRDLKPTETVERRAPVVGVEGREQEERGRFNPALESEEEKKEFFDSEQVLGKKLDRAVDWLRASKHAIIFTGAGISTSCGIPDFRSGMDTVLPTGPGVWEIRAHGTAPNKPRHVVPILRALPSPSHMAVVQLHRKGLVHFTVSQNVDGLHRRSGLGPTQLAELHGNTNLETCRRCHRQYLRDFETREAMGVFEHGTSRLCDDPKCRGVLEDSIINFGENLPEKELKSAFDHAQKADLCIVLGSSLRVRPACQVPEVVQAAGGKVIICNLQRIPQFPEDNRTIHMFCKVDDFMQGLLSRLGLDIPPFTLQRRVRISSEQLGKSLVITVTGLDTDEDMPYSFIKAVSINHEGVSYEASAEPLLLTLPLTDSLLTLTLHFQGHYREPPLPLTFDPHSGDRTVNMSYDIEGGKWNIV